MWPFLPQQRQTMLRVRLRPAGTAGARRSRVGQLHERCPSSPHRRHVTALRESCCVSASSSCCRLRYASFRRCRFVSGATSVLLAAGTGGSALCAPTNSSSSSSFSAFSVLCTRGLAGSGRPRFPPRGAAAGADARAGAAAGAFRPLPFLTSSSRSNASSSAAPPPAAVGTTSNPSSPSSCCAPTGFLLIWLHNSVTPKNEKCESKSRKKPKD